MSSRKIFNKVKAIKENARIWVGPPKSTKIILPKNKRKERFKSTLSQIIHDSSHHNDYKLGSKFDFDSEREKF